MQKSVYFSDVSGKMLQDSEVVNFHLFSHRETDAAGDVDSVYIDADCSASEATAILNDVLRPEVVDIREELTKRLRAILSVKR